MNKLILSILSLIIVFSACKKDKDIIDNTPAVNFDCNNRIINVNTTWEDVNSDPNKIDYIINCSVFVTEGSILTIKPGVRIQFVGATSGIVVQDDGGIVANGGQGQGANQGKIILEGVNHTKGEWSGVIIRSINPLTSFSYVEFKDAGSKGIVTGLTGAGLEINTAPVGSNVVSNVSNCTFDNNKNYGFVAIYNTKISNFNTNIFNNNELAPIRIDAFNMNMLKDNNTFFGNGQNYIDVYKGHHTDGYIESITVRKIDMPYRIAANEKLKMKTGDLTIEPGVVLEMGTNSEITMYDITTSTGRILANGTASEPIIMRGVEDIVGCWKGISIGTNLTNQLTYVNISNAGSAAIATYDPDYITAILVSKTRSARAAITNCSISKSGGYGICYGTTANLTQSSNTFTGNSLSDTYTF